MIQFVISVTNRLKSGICHYVSDRRGAAAVVFALMIPAVVSATGLSVDLARAYLVKQRLSHSLDAAALAAGSSTSLSGSVLTARMNAFLEKNFYSGSEGALFDVTLTEVGSNMTVSASASVDTLFMGLVGIEVVTVHSQSTIQRDVRGLEVSLALDVTGSMQTNNNIGALRAATQDFINILFSRVSNPNNLKIGLVPYAATVNVGSTANTLVSTPFVPSRPSTTFAPGVYGNTTSMSNLNWRGCVRERAYPNDVMDTDTATGGLWTAFWYASTPSPNQNDNRWDTAQGGSTNYSVSQCNNRRTPNLGCPETNPIVPMTSNQFTLLNAAGNLTYWCRGGTIGNIGLAWAWRVISPTPPFTEGAAYTDPMWRKAVVMMTDGENQLFKKPEIVGFTSDDTAYSRLNAGVLGTTSSSGSKTEINERMVETCTAMKEKGITIYTIVFTSSVGDGVKDYYRDCASDPSKFYDAPGQTELRTAFTNIAKELANLYITE